MGLLIMNVLSAIPLSGKKGGYGARSTTVMKIAAGFATLT
jgi:hypothetical protein